jgi:hypothetical protein
MQMGKKFLIFLIALMGVLNLIVACINDYHSRGIFVAFFCFIAALALAITRVQQK